MNYIKIIICVYETISYSAISWLTKSLHLRVLPKKSKQLHFHALCKQYMPQKLKAIVRKCNYWTLFREDTQIHGRHDAWAQFYMWHRGTYTSPWSAERNDRYWLETGTLSSLKYARVVPLTTTHFIMRILNAMPCRKPAKYPWHVFRYNNMQMLWLIGSRLDQCNLRLIESGTVGILGER